MQGHSDCLAQSQYFKYLLLLLLSSLFELSNYFNIAKMQNYMGSRIVTYLQLAF